MLNGYKVLQNSAFTGSIFTKVTPDFVSNENIMYIDFFWLLPISNLCVGFSIFGTMLMFSDSN